MASPKSKKLSIQRRSRSVPFPKPFWKAAIFSFFFLLTVIALIASIIVFAIDQTQKSAFLVVGVLFFTLFVWIVSLFIRRSASCPLCHGTPYFNSGAHKHEKATKLPLLNHAISNVVRTIVNQTFRCMYCGQPFDLLKPVTNPLSGRKKVDKKAPKQPQRRQRRKTIKKEIS